MFYGGNAIKEKMTEAGRAKTPFLFGVNFEMSEGFFVPNPLQQQAILFDINGTGNAGRYVGEIPEFSFDGTPEDFCTYQHRFNRVMSGLQRGDSYLTNLTIKTPLQTSLSLRDIFTYSRAMYRLFVPDEFVCFSPECFVKIGGGKIYTYPMKGTIDADIPNAAAIILNDYKETAEHNTIVDLLRNDLSRIATKVKVNRFRYIDALQTNKKAILQVSSEIEGTLSENYLENLGEHFFALLPAGSVSGAPKEATLRIIGEAECATRGFYTGVAGYFDGTNLDTCVLIRFVEQAGDALFFRSGGGITVNSVCQSEYDEAVRKVYVPFGGMGR